MKRNIFFCFALLNVVVLFGQTTKKIACVGNSITYGYGLSSPTTQSYPAQLQALLGTTLWSVGNYGVNSRTMLKKGDKPYWSVTAYTNAKAYLPNYVMIELGTNDAKTINWNPYGKEFVSDYKEMIQVFQGLSSKPEVWIGLIPPGQYVGWTIYSTYIKDSVNIKIKQIALESGVGLIDMFDALNGNAANWYNTTIFQADSIHPKTAGAAIIAQKVKEMITMSKPQIAYLNGKINAPTAYGYQWYYNSSVISVADGGNMKEITPTKTGKYKVSLKLNSTNETRIISNEIEISQLSANIENVNSEYIKVYPNPTTDGKIKIETPSGFSNYQVSVFDLTGKICYEKEFNTENESVNINNLVRGNYLIKVLTNNQAYWSKIIKTL